MLKSHLLIVSLASVILFLITCAVIWVWFSLDVFPPWVVPVIAFAPWGVVIAGEKIYDFAKGRDTKKELFMVLLFAPFIGSLAILFGVISWMLLQGFALAVLYIVTPIFIIMGLYGLIRKLLKKLLNRRLP